MSGVVCALLGAAGSGVTFSFSEGETISVTGASSALATLTCRPAGSWTVTRSGTGDGTPATGTYGPQTSLTFLLTSNAGQLKSNSWAVSVTTSGVTRTCTVNLTANNV